MASGGYYSDIYKPKPSRYLPTISIINHSTTVKRKSKNDPNFTARAHDPRIIDDEKPREAAQLLLLELNISLRNFKEHRIVLISSPYKKCLQTATIVAQELGVRSIQVFYEIGDSVASSRDAGWDFAYEPLTVSRSEMDDIVEKKSIEGMEEHNSESVVIDAEIGTQLTVDDIQENDVRYTYRLGKALDQAAACLEMDGDHVVIVGHPSTIIEGAKHFIDNCNLYGDADCGYITIACPSDSSCWLEAHSRINLKPTRTANPYLKIGHQLDGDPFASDD